jgi:hypothetical protein
MDQDARRGANSFAEQTTSASPRSARRPSPCPCGQGRQVPYRPQADPRSRHWPASRHGPRPLERQVPWHYTEMAPALRRGHLGADAGKRDWDESTAEYGAQLMEGLGVRCPEPVEGMGCKRSGRDQACERAPAPDGLPEEPPVERRQSLPAVVYGSCASLRTTGRGCCRSSCP